MASTGKIAWLFTTFPTATETFLQREVRACKKLGLPMELYSLWGGGENFEGLPIRKFPKWRLLALLWRLPFLLLTRPKALAKSLGPYLQRPPPSIINFCENLIGLSFAILYAEHFKVSRPLLFHAVWATMPTTAARLLQALTGIPYSMGAHAYDVFENGGDWILKEKLREAQFIHTTTEATRKTLLSYGAEPAKIHLIRRGLLPLPSLQPLRKSRTKVRLVSIGRLIEKKGWAGQLDIYAALAASGVDFEACLIGKGPLRSQLMRKRNRLKLSHRVRFLGGLSEKQTMHELSRADIFLFTGIVAPNGDRDGLPNVIPEAMATGLCVLTTSVGGTLEAIENGKTGLVLPPDSPEKWVAAIQKIQRNDDFSENLRKEAREWVEENFDAFLNSQKLIQAFASVKS